MSAPVSQDADRLQGGRLGHVRVGLLDLTGEAAGRRQVARPKVGRQVGKELVGGIARAVGDADVVADEEGGAAAGLQLQALVLPDGRDPGDDHIARAWGRVRVGQQAGGAVQVDAAGGVGPLGLGDQLLDGIVRGGTGARGGERNHRWLLGSDGAWCTARQRR